MKPRHLSLLVPAVLALMFAAGCASDTYNAYKWKTIHLGNDLVDLRVVPEIGGRVLQYSLGDDDFFWVNEELENTRPPASGVGPEGEDLSIKRRTRALEARLIGLALEQTGGNRTQAARILEISPRALQYKLKEYGIA